VIGLRGKDGVVFAVEKLVTSKLYEVGANKRIFSIDKNVGMVSSKKNFLFGVVRKYVQFSQKCDRPNIMSYFVICNKV
jgi:hypothetical protein